MMELRDYQIEDVEKLCKLINAGCFNEQRTGKTPTALKTLEKHGTTKNLIICPASAIPVWAEEYKLWLNKPCVALTGTKAKKEKLLKNWEHGLIMNYETLKETERSTGFVEEILKHKPQAVVLDEAHRIKNPRSKNTKAIFKLIKTPIRLALTGTPAPGKPEEIFPILKWIEPEKFTSYWKFIEENFEMTPRLNTITMQEYTEIGAFLPGKETELQIYLNTIATMRKRKEVMPWLPNKDYQKIMLKPTSTQQKYLKELKEYYETESIIVKGTLDRLIRYRQICLHPQLLGLQSKSPKLEWLKDFIKDYPDKPILVFSKFTSFIKILEKELKLGGQSIIGETPIPERNRIVKAFQNGNINVLLLNIDAGKEALTLDRAETVIFTDKYPPIGDIQQAEDRFVATTKDKAKKPHTIYELILKGTYDEEIHKLLAKRATAVDVINNFKKYIGGN